LKSFQENGYLKTIEKLSFQAVLLKPAMIWIANLVETTIAIFEKADHIFKT